MNCVYGSATEGSLVSIVSGPAKIFDNIHHPFWIRSSLLIILTKLDQINNYFIQ